MNRPHITTTLEEARAHVLVAARKWGALLVSCKGVFTTPGSFDEMVKAEGETKHAAEVYTAIEETDSTMEGLRADKRHLEAELDRAKQEIADLKAASIYGRAPE